MAAELIYAFRIMRLPLLDAGGSTIGQIEDIVVIPGALTPSEVSTAWQAGADFVIEVIRIDPAECLIYLAGAVPGPRGGLVTIFETVKSKKARVEIVRSSTQAIGLSHLMR